MTYRFGRTNKLRYAAVVSGIPAYDNNAAAPPPTGNRAPLRGVRPVPTEVPGVEHTGWPSDPQYACGEDENGRKYALTAVPTRVPGIDWTGHPSDPQYACGEDEGGGRKYGQRRRKKRRRKRKATLRRARRRGAILGRDVARTRGCPPKGSPEKECIKLDGTCVTCPPWA